MEEERIYKSLLIKKSDNSYLGWEPTHNPDPNLPDIGAGMYEVEWNKPLPEDIDTKTYTQAELEEWYNDNYDENGELKAV